MKAYVVDNNQSSGVRFSDVSDPSPAPNEALIEVEAFSLNRGELPGGGVFPNATVPGWDTAGRVLAAAADGSGPSIGTRLFGTPNANAYVKDGINSCVVDGRPDAVNPQQTGTKAAAHSTLSVRPEGTATIRQRLADAPAAVDDPFKRFADTLRARQREADEFYRAVTPARVGADEARVIRQAMAGMLWNTQYFGFDVDFWLEEHGVNPKRPSGRSGTASGST
jgi:hypothetical protein